VGLGELGLGFLAGGEVGSGVGGGDRGGGFGGLALSLQRAASAAARLSASSLRSHGASASLHVVTASSQRSSSGATAWTALAASSCGFFSAARAASASLLAWRSMSSSLDTASAWPWFATPSPSRNPAASANRSLMWAAKPSKASAGGLFAPSKMRGLGASSATAALLS
jgi:hypothetical protein